MSVATETDRVDSHRADKPTERRWLARLGGLVELERAFCAACNAAADRVCSAATRDQIRSLIPRSQAARHAVTERIEALGGIAPDVCSSRDRIGNGAALIRHLNRTDRVLTALRSALDEVDAGYALAIAHDALPASERRWLTEQRAAVARRRAALVTMTRHGG